MFPWQCPQDPLAWTPELATDDARLPWLGFFFRMGFLAGDIYAGSTRWKIGFSSIFLDFVIFVFWDVDGIFMGIYRMLDGIL